MQQNAFMLTTFGQNKRNIEIFNNADRLSWEQKKMSSRRMILKPVKSGCFISKNLIFIVRLLKLQLF